MPHVRSPDRLDTARSGLLVIDVQQRLVPVIDGSQRLVSQIDRLVQAANLLDVPMAATVQYPKGLGPLVEPLAIGLPSPEEKLDFSAAVCRGALDHWAAESRDQIIVTGIETHVCVLQTVLDLLAEGQRPHVVADAVSSRNVQDGQVAIDQMRDAGAVIMTSEAVLFQWLSSAAHPAFKSISQLIKS